MRLGQVLVADPRGEIVQFASDVVEALIEVGRRALASREGADDILVQAHAFSLRTLGQSSVQ